MRPKIRLAETKKGDWIIDIESKLDNIHENLLNAPEFPEYVMSLGNLALSYAKAFEAQMFFAVNSMSRSDKKETSETEIEK